MSWFRLFLRQQFKSLPDVDSFDVDLSGRTAIVVGSNTGLGLEASRHLASMMARSANGGRLILACRNTSKGEEALNSIKASTGFSGMEVWEVDLADFASVKSFCDRFEKDGGGSLDLLVMNSGISTLNFNKTADDWESQLQVNFLGTALLSLRMVPFLSKVGRRNPFPRLVIVASDMHYVAHLSPKVLASESILAALNDETMSRGTMHQRYAVTKLFDVMFVRALARHLPASSPLEVDSANPGLCRSSLLRDLSAPLLAAFQVFSYLFARTTEEGGRCIAYAAVSSSDAAPAGASQVTNESDKPFHGKFISACQIETESSFTRSDEGRKLEDRLWAEMVEILSRVDENIPSVLSVYLQ